MHKERMIKVFAGTMWEAELVKSLLLSVHIDSFLTNTVLNSYAFEPIRSENVQVMILESKHKKAQEVIDEYNKSKNETL